MFLSTSDQGRAGSSIRLPATHLLRVVGVEVSEELNRIANQNLRNMTNKLRCQNVEFVTTDAAAFPIPDDMTIAYLYHPFGGETFKTLINNIITSVDQHPREVMVVYQMPMMEDFLLSTGRFKLLRIPKYTAGNPRRIAVYKTIAD